MAIIKAQNKAAEELGITPRQLRNWQKDSEFPDCSKGYDVEAIKAWREENSRKGSTEDLTTLSEAVRTKIAKRKKAENDAVLGEIEIAKERKHLIPRQVVHQILMEVASRIRSVTRQLQKMGNDTAVDLITVQINEIRKIVNDRLGDGDEGIAAG